MLGKWKKSVSNHSLIHTHAPRTPPSPRQAQIKWPRFPIVGFLLSLSVRNGAKPRFGWIFTIGGQSGPDLSGFHSVFVFISAHSWLMLFALFVTFCGDPTAEVRCI